MIPFHTKKGKFSLIYPDGNLLSYSFADGSIFANYADKDPMFLCKGTLISEYEDITEEQCVEIVHKAQYGKYKNYQIGYYHLQTAKSSLDTLIGSLIYRSGFHGLIIIKL